MPVKIHCPNKNAPEYKELEKTFGPERAFVAFVRHEGAGLPTIEQARTLLTPAAAKNKIKTIKPLISPAETGIIKGKGQEVITTTKPPEEGKRGTEPEQLPAKPATGAEPAAGKPAGPSEHAAPTKIPARPAEPKAGAAAPTEAAKPAAAGTGTNIAGRPEGADQLGDRGAAAVGEGAAPVRAQPAEEGGVTPGGTEGVRPGDRTGTPAGKVRDVSERGGGGGGTGSLAAGSDGGARGSRGDEPRLIDHTPEGRKKQRLIDYLIQEADNIGHGGPAAKLKDNLNAIKILKQIESENRHATPEEQQALVRYVGWGGLSATFKESNIAHDELKGLLTKEEYAAARASTTNAHYTSPAVIQSIWNAITRMGFNGGPTLEPATGIGHFFGLRPTSLNMSMEGIELDPISGRIAQQLYQNAIIQIQGYETLKMPKDYYQLILSNVPFSEISPVEPSDAATPDLPKGMALHDFYFMKSLYGLRPGGLLGFVTSHYTMDKKNPSVRQAIIKQADFIGAVRLPDTAFKENAGTEVVTDIIFLQKRAPNQPPSEMSKLFVESGAVSMDAPKAGGKKDMFVNKYFQNHEEMVLGKPTLGGTRYGGDQYTVELDPAVTHEQFEEMLFNAADKFPKDIVTPYVDENNLHVSFDEFDQPEDIKRMAPGSFFVEKDVLYQKNPETGFVNKVPEGKNHDKIHRMAEIKSIMQKMFDAERLEEGAESKKYLAKLNAAYDSFVKKHGPINNKRTFNLIKQDPARYQLAALENYDDQTDTAKKTAIFKGYSFTRDKAIEKTDSAQDALIVSLNQYGSVNIHRIADMLGMDGPATVDKLLAERLVFRSPEDYLNGKRELYQSRDEYLSGNVRQKLLKAKEAAKKYRMFDLNVRELETIIPPDKPAERISVRMNSPLLQHTDIEEFLKDTFGANNVSANHNSFNGQWDIKIGGYYNSRLVEETYGTPRMNGIEIMRELMAGRRPKIYDTVSDPLPDDPGHAKEVFNEQESAAAQARADEIKKKFTEWLWSDNERKERIVRDYNDRFNAFVNREYIHPKRIKDPSAQVFFTGSSFPWPARIHQADAVWRIIQNKNTMLAHGVGSGKTLEMIWAGQEARRLGLAKKPMHVFPNKLIRQWTADFYSAYPHANILVANEGDLSPDKRRLFINKIATGDWDAVLIKREDFKKIPLSPREEAEQISEEINQYQNYLKAYETEHANESFGSKKKKPRSVKQLEKKLESYKQKRQGLLNKARKERGTLYFEDLGIDFLTIDEADEFKNLEYYTALEGVRGMGSPMGSGRSYDMFHKSKYLTRKGARLIFSTGTPISNSLVEAYSMMKYLQRDWLHENNIESFDDWSRLFADTVTEMELDNSGSAYRPTTRFSRLTNVPEFMKALREVWDIKTNNYLKDKGILVPGKNLPLEKVINIAAPASDLMKSFKRYLVRREKGLKGQRAEKGADNVLVIIDDGKKAALDLRLFSPNLPDLPDSKLNQGVRNILETYKKYNNQKYTQLVFIDRPRSYRKGPGGEDVMTFDATADMIKKLVAGGIPQEEIVDITNPKYDKEAPKQQLFDAVRSGKVRVLFGSVEKLGVGVNVQDHGKAVHQLDARWRPRDYDQSNGRFVRQGNKVVDFDENGKRTTPAGELGTVEIYNYVTKGSLDTGIWNMLEVKSKSINTIMDTRPEDLQDEIEEDYFGSVKDLSIEDPIMKEAMTLRHRVKELENLERVHINDISHHKAEIRAIPERIARLNKNIAAYKADVTQREPEKTVEVKPGAAPSEEKQFSIFVDGKTYDKRTEAGAALLKVITALEKKMKDRNSNGEEQKNIGRFAGFNISARTKLGWYMPERKAGAVTTSGEVFGVQGPISEIVVNGKYNYVGQLSPSSRSPIGLVASLHDAVYKRMDQNLKNEQAAVAEQEKNLEDDKAKENVTFTLADELAQKKARMNELDKVLADHKEEEIKPEDEPVRWEKERAFIPTGEAIEPVNEEDAEGRVEAGSGGVEESQAPYGETPDLFKGTEFEDTRTKGQREIAEEEQRRAEARKEIMRENPLEGTPLFDKNEQEARATEQVDLFKPEDLGYTAEDVNATFGSMEALNETNRQVRETLRNIRPAEVPEAGIREENRPGIRRGKRTSSAVPEPEVSGRERTPGRPYSRTKGTVRGVGRAGQSIIEASWNKLHRIDFTGKVVTSPQEIAQLFSIFRHPNIEHVHLIYVNNKNEIVAHNTMSAGLANQSKAVEDADDFARSMYRVKNRMERLGANKIFMVHNHPGGDPTPSYADLALTRKYSDTLGKGFVAHIVINGTEYAVINENGDFKGKYTYVPAKQYDLPTVKIYGHNEVVDAVKGVMKRGVKAVQVVLDNRNKITAWYPLRLGVTLHKQTLYQNQQNAGGTVSIVVASNTRGEPDAEKFVHEVREIYRSQGFKKDDVLLDVVYEGREPDNYITEKNMGPSLTYRGPDAYKSGFVWDEPAPYDQSTGIETAAARASRSSDETSDLETTGMNISPAEGLSTVQKPSTDLISEESPRRTQTRQVEDSRETMASSLSKENIEPPSSLNIRFGGGNYKKNLALVEENQPPYGYNEYKTELNDVLKKYDDGDENGNYLTEQDVFEEARRIAEDGFPSPEFSEAIDTYIKEVGEDLELGGRGDMDSANDNFMNALRKEAEGKRGAIVEEGRPPYGEVRGEGEDLDQIFGETNIEMKDMRGAPLGPVPIPQSTIGQKIARRVEDLYNEIAKTPAYTPYKKTLLTWQANVQKWSQYATAAEKYVKDELEKDPTKEEALSIYLEAQGDEETIRYQLQKTKDLIKNTKNDDQRKWMIKHKVVEGYEAALKLNEKDKEILSWVSDKYSALGKQAQERDLVDKIRDNYVTHLVDMEGDKPAGFSGKLALNFKFGRERTIPTLFEAEQLGYKPQTKKIGELLGIYIYELGKTIETRDFIANLNSTLMPDGRHIAMPMGSGDKVIPEEPGKKPFYLIRSRSLAKQYEDYLPVKHPAMMDWKYVSTTDNGEKVMYQGNLAVHPDVAGHLQNVLGTDAIREWYRKELPPIMGTVRDVIKTADLIQSGTKQSMFSLSGFHWVQEGTHAVGHWTNPFAGIDKIDLVNNPLHYRAAAHGLMMIADYDGMQNFREGLSSGPILYKLPVAGPMLEAISEPLFTWYIPGLKYKVYNNMLARNIKRYDRMIKSGERSVDDIEYLSARQTNAAFGHQNYIDMGRSKTIQHLLQSVFLAPDFLEARARFAGQAVKSIATLPEDVYRKIAGKTPKDHQNGREQLMALTTLAVLFWVGARVLNKLFGGEDFGHGDYHFEEPFSFVYKNRKYGLRSVPEDMWKLFKNTSQFISGRMSPILGKTVHWMLSHRDFRGQPQSAWQFLEEELLTWIPIGLSRMIKQGNKDIDWWQSLLTSMGLQVARYSKSTEIYLKAEAWRKEHEVQPDQGTYPISKYRDVRNALQDKNLQKASKEWQRVVAVEQKKEPDVTRGTIIKKLAHGFKIGLQHPFTGSKAREHEFYKSLDPVDKDAYNRAIQERKEVYNNFLKIYHGSFGEEVTEGAAPTVETPPPTPADEE